MPAFLFKTLQLVTCRQSTRHTSSRQQVMLTITITQDHVVAPDEAEARGLSEADALPWDLGPRLIIILRYSKCMLGCIVTQVDDIQLPFMEVTQLNPNNVSTELKSQYNSCYFILKGTRKNKILLIYSFSCFSCTSHLFNPSILLAVQFLTRTERLQI